MDLLKKKKKKENSQFEEGCSGLDSALTTKAHPSQVQLGLASPSMGSGHPTLLPRNRPAQKITSPFSAASNLVG